MTKTRFKAMILIHLIVLVFVAYSTLSSMTKMDYQPYQPNYRGVEFEGELLENPFSPIIWIEYYSPSYVYLRFSGEDTFNSATFNVTLPSSVKQLPADSSIKIEQLDSLCEVKITIEEGSAKEPEYIACDGVKLIDIPNGHYLGTLFQWYGLGRYSYSTYGFDITTLIKNRITRDPPVKVIFQSFSDDFLLSDETTPPDEFLYGDGYVYKWTMLETIFLHVRFEVPSMDIEYQKNFASYYLWLGFSLSTGFSLITQIALYWLEDKEKQT